MGSKGFAKTFLILSVILFIPAYTLLQDLRATKDSDSCCKCYDCKNDYKNTSVDNECCNAEYTYPDPPGTPTNDETTNPTPRCCPAYFGGYCCDAYTGICNGSQKAEPQALFDLLANVLFNGKVVPPLPAYECYCDNRCSPPQIVCTLNGDNVEVVPFSYCEECWELYCYCKGDSRITDDSKACEVLYEEYTTSYSTSARKSLPDCCYEEEPKLNCSICGDKKPEDIQHDCTPIPDLRLRN